MDLSPTLQSQQPLATPTAAPSFTSSLGGILELDRQFASLESNGLETVDPTSTPIELDGKDLVRFKHRFERGIATAKGRMTHIHDEVAKDRKTYIMLPKIPKYEGGPDITTPLSANKVDGVAAHLRDAIEQRPLVSFSPEGIGKEAERAANVAPLCEALIEREINRSSSREVIAGDMAKEAAQVGTGICTLSVARVNGELFVQLGEKIRLENFFVDRIKADNLRDVFCFYETKERQYNLDEMAEAGLYDTEAVKSLMRLSSSSTQAQIREEETYQFIESEAFAEENALRDLIKGYLRFRPEGESESEIYEVVMHEPSKTYLSIRKNPVRFAFDSPPIALFRIGKQSNYLFGRGITRRLENEQKIADKYLNNHLATSDMLGSPPYLYRESSAFGKALERVGKRGLVPGQAIPTQGQPNVGDVQPIQLYSGGAQVNLTNLEVAQQFADAASYQEAALGGDSGSRRTLGQYRVEVQKGTLRLRSDLADFAYDAALALSMYWSMVVTFKIEPQGIISVTNGKLLAAETIDTTTLSSSIAETVMPLLQSGEIDQATMQEFMGMYQGMLTNDSIPGVRDNNLSISLAGTRIISDKISEIELLTSLTPYISSFLQAAAQDRYAWYHLKSIFSAAGLQDIERRLPPEPQEVVMDNTQRSALFAPFNQLMSTSSNMV